MVAMSTSTHKSSRIRSDGGGGVDATKASIVSDRLRATEDALKVAQVMIADHEKRERELRKMLVSNGLPESPPSGSSGMKVDSGADAKMSAIKQVHDQKVRTLMRSINQLQEQIQSLKSQDKEHRRSALIQNLRKSQREQELLIDLLKQTLVEKVPEFQESKELVNDYLIKKSVGGPLRFRPKTREELENELEVLDGKYKRAVENLKKARDEASAAKPAEPVSARSQRQRVEKDRDDEADKSRGRANPIRSIGEELPGIDPRLQEEIDQLKVDLASKNITIHSQADEINELYGELDRLKVVEDKIERKKEKIASQDEKISKLQLDNVKLTHDKESEVEKCAHLREELQFLRDTRVGDVQASDSERLRQLELVQGLRARELELQRQIEEQQNKWSVDRTNVNQQMRLLEKEKQLLEEQARHAEAENAALAQKNDRLYVELETAKTQLQVLTAAKEALSKRVQELEDVVSVHESMSREEREAQAKTLGERLRDMDAALAAKDELAKKLDRQLNASKLLARQAKKEKEQLQERCTKLQDELKNATDSAS